MAIVRASTFVLVLALCPLVVRAQDSGRAWMVIAERALPAKKQTVQLPLNGIKGSFNQLRLQIVGAEVEITSLTVKFANQGSHTVAVNQVLSPGSYSEAIELPESFQRFMVRLDVTYTAKPFARVKVFGAADRWVKIAQAAMGVGGTHSLEVAAGESRYDMLRISVEESSLHLKGLTVHYTSGGSQAIKLFGIQGKNNLSRLVDLDGGAREIARVELSYQGFNAAKPPVVTVFARTAGAGVSSGGGEGDQAWQKLGEGWAALAKNKVEVRGLALRGMVNRQVRIQVEGKPLQVIDLTIVFGNNERQIVPINALLEPGAYSEAIQLDGTTKRTIARIKLRYEAKKALGRAKVRVFGQ